MKTDHPQRFYAVIAITGLVAVFFVLFIVTFQREENKRIAKESMAILESVTTSKRMLLSDWLQDEMHDVKLISKNPNVIELINRYLDGQAKENTMVSFFNQIKLEHDYAELVFLNEAGEHIVSINPALTFNDSIDTKIYAEALATDSCYLTDIYRSSIDHNLYIDFVTVIRDVYGRPLGGVVFKIHAENTIDKLLVHEDVAGYRILVALIQQLPNKKWVTYKPDTTSRINHECWQPLPARFRNNPYKSIDRLVRLMEIDNTPWSLMVELDNSQRKAQSSNFLILTSLLGVSSVLLFLLVLMLIVYNQEKKYTFKLRSNERELIRYQHQYNFIMDLLGEAVFITDNQGLIQYMNLSAEMVSGWTLSDVVGKPFDKEIPLLQVETGLPLLNVKNWFSGETAYHQYIAAHLINKDGSYIRVICSLAPIELPRGKTREGSAFLAANSGKGASESQDDSENNGLAVVLIKDDRKLMNAADQSERITIHFPPKQA